MLSFREQVIKYIKSVPKGKVVSYGQVASACGSPRASRQVGGVLRGLSDIEKVPWWRVINNQGIISIKGNWVATKDMQKRLLEEEGVEVSKEYQVDIEAYRYRKK